MRKRVSRILIILIMFTMLVSCGRQENNQQNIKNDFIYVISIEKGLSIDNIDIYNIVYSNGKTTSFTVTNGLNGLQGIQGEKGDDGHTPIITIGANGNWYIDGVDTTKPSNVKGDTGNGISSIEKTATTGLVDTYTITYTNGNTSTFSITNGEQGIQGIQGEKGDDGHTPVITIGANGNWYIDGVDTTKPSSVKGDTGNGISSIEKTATIGLIDTYTITYTNGTTSTFTVTNGAQGDSGEDGHTPLITIGANGNWYIDGVDTTKPSSVKGDTGIGILSIILTETNGLKDTYTITYTDNTTSTFDIYNAEPHGESDYFTPGLQFTYYPDLGYFVSGYYGDSLDLVIPENYNGSKVVGIDKLSLVYTYTYNNLNSVLLPKTVEIFGLESIDTNNLYVMGNVENILFYEECDCIYYENLFVYSDEHFHFGDGFFKFDDENNMIFDCCETEDITIIEPTCTMEGSSTYTCNICNREIKQVIYPKNHEYEKVGYSEPSCSEYGYPIYKCKNCDTEIKSNGSYIIDTNVNYSNYSKDENSNYNSILLASAYIVDNPYFLITNVQNYPLHLNLNSDYGNVFIYLNGNIYSRVVLMPGETAYIGINKAVNQLILSVILSVRLEIYNISIESADVLNKLEHDYEIIETKDSTCYEIGYTKKKCTVCGDIYYDYADPISHDYELVDHVDSSCTSTGYDKYECKNCHNIRIDTIETLEHNLTLKEEVEATCTTDGYIIEHCSICNNDYKTITNVAKGHNIVLEGYTDPTCTENGCPIYKCSKCGKNISLRDLYSFSYSTWYINSYYQYDLYEFYSLRNNDYNQPIIITANYPIVIYISYYDFYELRINDSYISGEDFNGEYTLYKGESLKISGYGGFLYINISACEYLEYLGHTGDVIVEKKADCLNTGYKLMHCDRCDKDVIVYDYATGHDYKAAGYTNPTCTEDSLIIYECSKCHDRKELEFYTIRNNYWNYNTANDTYYSNDYNTCNLYIDAEYDIDVTIDIIRNYYLSIQKNDYSIGFSSGMNSISLEKGDTLTIRGYNSTFSLEFTIPDSNIPKATGHNYELIEFKAATCKQDGFNKYQCKTCGDIYTETIPKLEHQFTTISETLATCGVAGQAVKHCSICNEDYTIIYPALSHEYEIVTYTMPTCTEYCHPIYKCKNCGDEYTGTQNIFKLDHDFIIVEEVKETCTENGYIIKHCSMCNEDYTTTYYATGHNYKKDGYTEPTCTEYGLPIYKCSKCGDTQIKQPNIYSINNDTNYPWIVDLENNILTSYMADDYYNSSVNITFNDNINLKINIDTLTLSYNDDLYLYINGSTYNHYSGNNKYNISLNIHSGDVLTLRYTKYVTYSSGEHNVKVSLIGALFDCVDKIDHNYVNHKCTICHSDEPMLNLSYVLNKYTTNNSNNVDSFYLGDSVELYDPIVNNGTFEGWYLDGLYQYPAPSTLTNLTTDTVLYAKTTMDDRTIIFNTNGGNDIESITSPIGSIVRLPIPTKNGYNFYGWYTDNTEMISAYYFNSNIMPEENITLYAKWNSITYSIVYNLPNSFVVNNSNNIFTYNIESNFEFINPTVTEGTFNGWYLDADYENEITSTTGYYQNLQLYAKVTMNKYTYTFVPNNGENDIVYTLDYGSHISYPRIEKEGEEFVAWCTTSELSTSYSKEQVEAKDVTIYAKFVEMKEVFTLDSKQRMLFGRYPQTYVNDSALIGQLNTLTSTNSNGYYEYMGKEYAKVYAKPHNNTYTFYDGTIVIYGNYYWFYVEPIRWIVLSNNGAYTLLSESLLDTTCFNNTSSSRQIGEVEIYANNYEYSDIRRWLNDEFYSKAFSQVERNDILETVVDNSPESTLVTQNSYTCPNTKDKVYLLSVEEVTTKSYGFAGSTGDTSTRQAKVTDFAVARGAFYNNSSNYLKNSYWWLRSPYYDYSSRAWCVESTGYVRNYIVSDSCNAVRAAITISID